ncbi:MAG: polysaccharide deacetylase family protein [Bacilli bacterium]
MKKIFNNITIKLLFVFFLEFVILILVNIKPVILIPATYVVKMSDEFQFPVVKAHFLKKDLTSHLRIKSNVNTKQAGIYNITYMIDYGIIRASNVLKVIINDDVLPEITLIGNNNFYLKKGSKYVEPGFKAFDNNDGNITNKVEMIGHIDVNKKGTYNILYTATDKSGNKKTVKRTIFVVEPEDHNLKTIYLTFDDGPSVITNQVLDILKQENIKATFFVIKKDPSFNDVIKRIDDEGHTIGLHSSTHDYKYIYSSLDNYFIDLMDVQNYAKAITGKISNIIRFPGGSSNTVSMFNKGIMSSLIKEVNKRGFVYYDWNIDSGDTRRIGSQAIINNVITNLGNYHSYVVLMHDYALNQQTVESLKGIIDYGKKNGYVFERITNGTFNVCHHVVN